MPKYKMLEELVCYCSSCKIELNHRIVLMDDEEITRVLCLTCNKEHKYRKNPPASRLKKTAADKNATTIQKARARQSTEEKEWCQKLEDPDTTPTAYNIKATFELYNVVQHKTFGKGLVIGFDHPQKVHIFFGDSIKVLKGNKAEVT